MFAGVALIVLTACTVAGQTATGPTAFDVASVKPGDPMAAGVHIGMSPGGAFTAGNASLKLLIEQAFDVRAFQIYGGPAWLDTDKYDIIAKGNGAGPSEEAMRQWTNDQRSAFREQMLVKVRTLLADRFQLRVHRETRELPVYALTVAKNGPKFHAGADGDVGRAGLNMRRGDGGQSEITATRASLEILATTLANLVGRTVIDRTGLTETYDFKLSFAPDMGPQDAVSSDGPSLFTALQEQLGLRLDSQKGPVEVIVIDNAQKASEN